MEGVPMHEEITQKLEEWIDRAREILPDFAERKIAIQTIPWVINKEIVQAIQSEPGESSIGSYIFLRKKSSGDIVFPSGGVNPHEVYQGKVSPQTLLLAAMREFKEELYGLLSIDMDNFIDVYPHLAFENNQKKYVQFRLLVKIDPNKINNIETQFQQAYEKEEAQSIPEHNACYIASYDQAMKHIKQGVWNMKESAHLSLEHHKRSTQFGAYRHKI